MSGPCARHFEARPAADGRAAPELRVRRPAADGAGGALNLMERWPMADVRRDSAGNVMIYSSADA